MALLLEMPADVDVVQGAGVPQDVLDAADEAANMIDQIDAMGDDDVPDVDPDIADAGLPIADGQPGGAPFDPDIAASLPASDQPDPPDAPSAKPKRGRKKKSEQVEQPKSEQPAAAESSPATTASADPLPPNTSPATRKFQITKVTADYVEISLEVNECELLIERSKSRLKDLQEQQSDLAKELVALRNNEQWQPPLFEQPNKSPPAAAVSDQSSQGDSGKCEASPETAPATEAVTEVATTAANVDPEAWKSIPLAELHLSAKLAEKLIEAGVDTIGRLENLRAEISQARAVWPKGIGKARITEIEDAVMDWLGKNRDAAVLAEARGDRPAVAESSAATPAAAPAIKTPTATPTKENWNDLTEQQQLDFICARAVILDDGKENSLATKHPETSKYWDSGYEAFGKTIDGRELQVSDCPYIIGDEQDDWLRGFLAHGAVEKYEPDAKAAKGKPTAEEKPATATKKKAPAKPTAAGPTLTDLDDL